MINKQIQTNRVKRDISFKVDTMYGVLNERLIYQSREKDPQILKHHKKFKEDNHYPKCLLCIENEGYAGRIGYPARSNHRDDQPDTL